VAVVFVQSPCYFIVLMSSSFASCPLCALSSMHNCSRISFELCDEAETSPIIRKKSSPDVIRESCVNSSLINLVLSKLYRTSSIRTG